MKKILVLLLITLSSVTSAQNSPGPQFSAMMGDFSLRMKQIEACYNKVDKVKIERFKQQSELNSRKVEALCIDSPDKAEALDNSFMKEAMKDPEIQAMMTCIENIPDNNSFMDSDNEEDTSHVCDF